MKILDTTLLVDFMRRRLEARHVVEKLENAGERPATTEVNAFELAAGTYVDGRVDKVKFAQVQQTLGRLDVLVLDRAGAFKAAELLSKLRSAGRTVGALDLLVAGIALASGYDTIVTRDEDFRAIPGLRLETY
mgnify:CR=1 FL=1